MKKQNENQKAFEPQIKSQIEWIDKNLGPMKMVFNTEPKNKKIFNREQELFYRATDYRGS